jgi:hypothetical protein
MRRSSASAEEVDERQTDALRVQMKEAGMSEEAVKAVFAGAQADLEKSGHKWYARWLSVLCCVFYSVVFAVCVVRVLLCWVSALEVYKGCCNVSGTVERRWILTTSSRQKCMSVCSFLLR